jgi:hypothetical protein
VYFIAPGEVVPTEYAYNQENKTLAQQPDWVSGFTTAKLPFQKVHVISFSQPSLRHTGFTFIQVHHSNRAREMATNRAISRAFINYLNVQPSKNQRGVTYSRPTTGTGMPLQERFGARPMWACLVACPVNEITSFVVDSSRSRKSVFQLFKSHTSFSGHPRIEGTGQVIMQAAIFADF